VLRKPYEREAGKVPLFREESEAAAIRANFSSLGKSLRVGETLCPNPMIDDLFLVYVPDSHDARYSSCSFVRMSISIPILASLSLAIFLSISSGTA